MKRCSHFITTKTLLILVGILVGLGPLPAVARSLDKLCELDSIPTPDSIGARKENPATLSPLVFKYAERLRVDPSSIDQAELWQFVEDWMGVRYVWGGNSKNGIDCSAFTERLLNEVYQIKSSRLVMGQYDKCKIIDSANLQLGDLIFFKTHNKRKGLTHVAFSLGGRYFIHASSSRGVVIDQLDKNYYRKTYRYSGRILPDKKEGSISPTTNSL
ncbi:MAG: C40 family peptidase [Bacteroidota bacterium]